MAALMSLSVILAAVGIVKPRHRFPEEREARVAAAVAAAGEEAEEFFHTLHIAPPFAAAIVSGWGRAMRRFDKYPSHLGHDPVSARNAARLQPQRPHDVMITGLVCSFMVLVLVWLVIFMSYLSHTI